MGPVFGSIPELGGRRAVSVGDIVTLGLLRKGIIPYAAAFDFRTMRAGIAESEKKELLSAFPSPLNAPNPAGTLTEEAISASKKAMSKGGAVLIDGEEDLVLLAFMKFARRNDAFLYGMAGLGVCLVEGLDGKRIAEEFIKRAEAVPPAHN
jgi:uncharacterized protein (UPF0218 family)